ncbi:F0F1 ATP synthase subunit delta [Candidatus Venteria ishoeyi]|uniref:ATP synthase subunit delta n=1 Tax=Candidatus Venteria ishoeyi TaxID=1899563 RepID=A0A1H6FI84_9GAMM|nr:F0F1 ATP synthase subunit delta [Candidatus Venteria ishoeyi]MDM8547372.1 F0F1 ATP synthase subunit delta [Candidatus Venteria ishoeyi]SEH08724.1 ATP synthase subunit delta [Candidatus Venteria ishoeyi]
MELATLARPYAEALFELAVETDNLTQWSNLIEFLSVVTSSPELEEITRNPQVDKETLLKFLWELCQEGCCQQTELSAEFEKQAENLIQTLVENDRLLAVAEIAKQYELLKAKQEAYVSVEVTSTYAVRAPQKAELIKMLEKRYGKKVNVNITIDRSLMGGWLIRANDQLIDLSVRGRLENMAVELQG